MDLANIKGFMPLAFVGTAFGTLGVFWNQAKNIFTRLSTVLVVKRELSRGPSITATFLFYLEENYQPSRFNLEDYNLHREHIRVLKRQAWYALTYPSRNKIQLYWKGWTPIFIKVISEGHGLEIFYIRGTLDFPTFLLGPIERLNTQDSKEFSKQQGRFRVKKFFGKDRSRAGEYAEKDSIAKNEQKAVSPPSGDSAFFKPLHWKREDLQPAAGELQYINALSLAPAQEEMYRRIKDWWEAKEWFYRQEHKIPWKFSAGLVGPPGGGKTSFVRAVAQELGIPVYVLDLMSMTNEEFTNYWKEATDDTPSIVLFEDMDRLFDKQGNFLPKELTLNTVLNCIQGVTENDGVLFFMTANDPSRMDSALGIPEEGSMKSSRPGRIDHFCYFGPLMEDQRRKLAGKILKSFQDNALFPTVLEELVKRGEGEMGAQFELRCVDLALNLYWKRESFESYLHKDPAGEEKHTPRLLELSSPQGDWGEHLKEELKPNKYLSPAHVAARAFKKSK
jgi:hypothetical protein